MSSINQNSLVCVGCGYDLSGTAVGGTCPECGLSVTQSMAGVSGGQAAKEASNMEVSTLVMGILSIVTCPFICGPLGLFFYSKYKRAIGPYGEVSAMARTGQVLSIIGTCLIVLQLGCCGLWLTADIDAPLFQGGGGW